MSRQSPGAALTKLATQKAVAALRSGEPQAALTWLARVPVGERPHVLEAEIRYALAKLAAAEGNWSRTERDLETVQRLAPSPFYQGRLERVRRRAAPLDDETWRMMREKIDPAKRLPPDWLKPAVSSIYSCGAYHSRGHGKGLPWSRLLRGAKNPPRDEEERAIILRVACGYLCRFIVADTPLLRDADVVVAIPPDRERYALRGMSLPDNLADAVQQQLALLWPMEALIRTKSVELRGLPWGERRHAIKGSMATRDGALVKGRCVLLVDDVTTSGATLTEAAMVLGTAGASEVHAVTLCHTEG